MEYITSVTLRYFCVVDERKICLPSMHDKQRLTFASPPPGQSVALLVIGVSEVQAGKCAMGAIASPTVPQIKPSALESVS